MLRGQIALVTGADGFVGRHLVSKLVRLGAEVHAVSRRFSAEEDGAVRRWGGDVADAKWISELMDRVHPDVVYQLTGASRGGQNVNNVLPTFENDLHTSVNVLIAAHQSQCKRVVITGSPDEPALEGEDMSCPQSPYAAAKAASRLYARMFHQIFATPVVMVRLFMVYGPGRQKSHKLLPYVIEAMLRGESPQLTAGHRILDCIHVDDLIAGLIAAGTSPGAIGQEIDLGSGTLISVRDLVGMVRELIPNAPSPTFGAIPNDLSLQPRRADLANAWEKMAWKPTIELRAGLRQTIAWYQEQQLKGTDGCAGSTRPDIT